ncbi:MAG: nitroreductase family protein, partial [Nanoarchaeota archaeon]|nr:nitroreductase family protein [Nanoarchaeota archaeon]
YLERLIKCFRYKNTMAIVSEIKKRHSIRQYKSKKVSKELINELLKAAMFAPSAKNQRCWEFIVTDNTKQLLDLTPYTLPLKTAPHAIIVIGDKNKSNHWIEDCSAAVENILLQATKLGLGTCWVNMYKSGDEKLRKIMSIPNNFEILCAISVGYPDRKKSDHLDKEFEKQKIHYEKF